MWAELLPIGRSSASGGYRRFAWTGADADCRAWFRRAGRGARADLRGRPQRQPVGLARRPARPATPSSPARTWTPCPTAAPSTARSASSPPSPRWTNCAPRGAQFDQAARHRQLRRRGGRPLRRSPASAPGWPPGQLTADAGPPRCATPTGSPCPQAMERAGYDPDAIGPDPERLARIGAFVELHVEQGRALDLGRRPRSASPPPSGRTAAGASTSAARPTTPAPPAWRTAATRCCLRRRPCSPPARRPGSPGPLATFGKVAVEPNGVNAIPSLVRGWLDSRAADQDTLDTVVAGDRAGRRASAPRARASNVDVVRESFTPVVEFEHAPARRARPILARARRRARCPSCRPAPDTTPGILSGDRPDRHAVRTQPHRRLALPGRVRRRGRLPGRGDRARRRTGGAGVPLTTQTYWLEHAWLGDRVEPGVLPSDRRPDGRITEVRTGVAAPPPGAVPLRGLTLPGLANAHSHAFHRALRGTVQVGTGTFWTWREVDVLRRRPAHPRHLLRPRPRRVRRDGARRHHLPSASSTTCTTRPAARRYADPNAMGEALIAAAADAGIRITLLDTAYLSSGFGAAAQPSTSCASATAPPTRWAERAVALKDRRATPGSARRSTPCAPCPPAELATVARVGRGAARPAARPPVRADRRERRLPRGPRPHARPAARRPRRAGPAHHRACTPPTSPTRTSRLLGGSGTGVCMCPTTERDLADGIGPAAAPPARRAARCRLGSDSHAVIDLLEEARAMELDERLRTRTRGHWTAAALLRAATADGHAALGWHDAGASRPARSPTSPPIALDSVRTAGPLPRLGAETAVFAATARRRAAHGRRRPAHRPRRRAHPRTGRADRARGRRRGPAAIAARARG